MTFLRVRTYHVFRIEITGFVHVVSFSVLGDQNVPSSGSYRVGIRRLEITPSTDSFDGFGGDWQDEVNKFVLATCSCERQVSIRREVSRERDSKEAIVKYRIFFIEHGINVLD